MKNSFQLEIKPLSVNEAWQGRRFKTAKYRNFEKKVLYCLPRFDIPEPPFGIEIIFGFSNKASDIDNPAKPLIDILQKKYKFNDSAVYELRLKKTIVPKGKEFFNIRFFALDNPI